MPTATPAPAAAASAYTRHGLAVHFPAEAAARGYASITNDIHAHDEAAILASVCAGRHPDRACLILIRPHTFQLAIRREDLSRTAG